MNGLSGINLELTSRCNKECPMCGRREADRESPQNWGDMEFSLVEKIAKQIPDGVVVQFHNNGEPLLYPHFGEAISLFQSQVKCVDTNGKLLMEKYNDIVDNLDTISVSVIENDDESLEQWLTLREFVQKKGKRKPLVVARCLGKVNPEPYYSLADVVVTRVLHAPGGSYDYQKPVTIPEIGVCLEALHHLSIDRFGYVSMCVRFDPTHEGIIGDANSQTLEEIWNETARKVAIQKHLEGKRKEVPLCRKCDYWGVPRGN